MCEFSFVTLNEEENTKSKVRRTPSVKFWLLVVGTSRHRYKLTKTGHWLLEFKHSVKWNWKRKRTAIQLLKPMPMIPIVLQKWGYEPGVPLDTPNEQIGQACPGLHPDPRGLEGQNAEEHEDQGPWVPKFTFDSDQLDEDAQHRPRFMSSWGEYRCPDNILSINTCQFRGEPG